MRFTHDILQNGLNRYANKIAVLDKEKSVTYAELWANTGSAASWMCDNGIGRGDRILLLLDNSIQLASLIFASSRIGSIFTIIDPRTTLYNIEYIVEDSSPKIIIASTHDKKYGELKDKNYPLVSIENVWRRMISASKIDNQYNTGISLDPVCLIYTSGSTSRPKAVMSNHHNITFAVSSIQQRLGILSSDVIGNFLPLSFDYGLYQVFLGINAGASLYLGDGSQVGPGLVKLIDNHKISCLPIVPGIAEILTKLGNRVPDQLSGLRLITNTGAHLSKDQIKRLRSLIPECLIYKMYGLTECKRVSILTPEEYVDRPDSVGKPISDTECFIVDMNGGVLPPDQKGELVVRGHHVMMGYWNDQDLTDTTFRIRPNSSEKLLYTGDICSMDSDGYIYFYGRNDDLYKNQGFRVSAFEVEIATCEIAGVKEAALIVPDKYDSSILYVRSLFKTLFLGRIA